MRISRESLLLVVVPSLFLGAAYVLLFCAERPSDGPPLRFAATRSLLGEVAPEPGTRFSPLPGAGVHATPIHMESTGGGQRRRAEGGDALPIATVPYEAPRPSGERSPGEGSGDVSEKGSRPEGAPSRSPIKGRIVGTGDRPLKGARVTVTESGSTRIGLGDRPVDGVIVTYEVPVNEDGSFVVDREPGRSYEITVTAQGHAPEVIPGYAVTNALLVQLSALGSLSGTVRGLDPTGEGALPLSGVRVRLLTGKGVERSTWTNGNGHFDFAYVGSGPAVISASKDGYKPRRIFVPYVAQGRTSEVNLLLEPGLTQKGFVMTGLDESPVVNARVRITDVARGTLVHSSSTDVTGCFTATELEWGRTYVVEVSDLTGGLARTAVFLDTPSAGLLPQITITMLPAEARSVIVRSESGVALGDVDVYMVARIGSLDILDDVQRTDGEGTAMFSGLDPRADVIFVAVREGYAVTALGPLALAAQMPGDPFEIVMPGGLELRGVVRDLEGLPLGGVTLRMSSVEGPGLGLGDVYTVSDETGRFVFSSLPPETMLLTTLAAGYDSLEVLVDLEHRDPQTLLPLVLRPLDRD